ncbi:hypothetical protein B4113_3017 [Geobacillus sp. B4113_201601]|nr:hypothetical protein B4113_3017 [Geobacillus sp. B4113_201601]
MLIPFHQNSPCFPQRKTDILSVPLPTPAQDRPGQRAGDALPRQPDRFSRQRRP